MKSKLLFHLSHAFGSKRFDKTRRRGWMVPMAAAASLAALSPFHAAAAPLAETTVFFNHGESPGREEVTDGTYTANLDFTDPDTADVYYGNGSASVTAPESDFDSVNGLRSLHAYANASSGGNSEGVAATATFSDNLDFLSDSSFYSGQSVTIFTFIFQVTGSLSGDANAQLNVSYGSDSFGYDLVPGTTTYSFTVKSDDLTYEGGGVYGGAFSEELIASVNNNATDGTNTADFSDTVQLEEVTAADSNGNVVEGAFSDEDQILFPSNTNFLPVPEPATSALLLGSLLIVLPSLWWQRQKANVV